MKPTIAALVIIAAALALSGEPPKQAHSSQQSLQRTTDEESMYQEVVRTQKRISELESQLAQAKSVTDTLVLPPEPVAAVVDAPSTSGAGFCANGSCSASRQRRVFTGERRPVRRVLAGRPRLFGRR